MASICTKCFFIGEPKTHTPGSLGMELLLWLLLFVPGMIYTLWRLIKRTKGCPVCQSPMVKMGTPEGDHIMAMAKK